MAFEWFVASTKAGQGQVALRHLDNQAIKAYLPSVIETRIERGRQLDRKLLLFPGYIFINLDLDDPAERWGKINSTIGCGRLLPHGDQLPMALPVGFVEDLIALENSGGLTAVRAECVVHEYTGGDAVRVVAGAFDGFTGEFVRYRKGSLILLMGLFGRKFERRFAANEVMPASIEPPVVGPITTRTGTMAPQYRRRGRPHGEMVEARSA